MDRNKAEGQSAGSPSGIIPTTVFRYKQRHPLNAIFEPKNIAVIGATEKAGSIGRTLLWNLITNPFGGTVFPIHASQSSILGIKAYPNLGILPEQIDLAVIVTPAATVSGSIAECVEAGVKGAIVISDDFQEDSAAGVERKQQILEQVRREKCA